MSNTHKKILNRIIRWDLPQVSSDVIVFIFHFLQKVNETSRNEIIMKRGVFIYFGGFFPALLAWIELFFDLGKMFLE